MRRVPPQADLAVLTALSCLICDAGDLAGEARGPAGRCSGAGRAAQDARKGVLFEAYPPVLMLHLKRFDYDYERDLSLKVSYYPILHSRLQFSTRSRTSRAEIRARRTCGDSHQKQHALQVTAHPQACWGWMAWRGHLLRHRAAGQGGAHRGSAVAATCWVKRT